MDTELLKTFLEVQRTRHFGKAAENLYLTQSAVSFRIRQLEQQLGVHLFIRYRNNIQLTLAGERLLPHAQTMLAALQRARQDVAMSSQPLRQLALAAPSTIWDALLQPAFLKVQAAKPDICWRLDQLNRESLTRQLLAHQLDLALLFDPPKTDDITLSKLTDVTLLAVTSPGAEHVHKALARPYCYVDWGSTFELQHQRIYPEHIAVALRSNSATLALQWLLQGAGCAFLPEAMVMPYLTDGRLTRLAGTAPVTLPLFAAHLTDNTLYQELQDVITLLQQVL